MVGLGLASTSMPKKLIFFEFVSNNAETGVYQMQCNFDAGRISTMSFYDIRLRILRPFVASPATAIETCTFSMAYSSAELFLCVAGGW